MTLCLVELVLSACSSLIFLVVIIYMLIINRCKFNKRTKVVIMTISISMCLSIGSSSLTYAK